MEFKTIDMQGCNIVSVLRAIPTYQVYNNSGSWMKCSFSPLYTQTANIPSCVTKTSADSVK